MLISTVILSYNSVKPIQRCLDQLISSLSVFDEESEIFIVDNGSKDGSVELIKQYESKYQESQPELIKPIFFSENTGTTYSRNAQLKLKAKEKAGGASAVRKQTKERAQTLIAKQNFDLLV